MIELLYEYKQTFRNTKKLRAELQANAKTPKDEEDTKQYDFMISDLRYTIEWIQYGRRPYAKRGYDKRDVYSLLMENELLSAMGDPLPDKTPEANISSVEAERIEDALSSLTKKEKDAYVLHHAEQLSYERIAKLMNVKKSTVQGHMERAEKKVKEQIEYSLFQPD